jgi:hypothetical protein
MMVAAQQTAFRRTGDLYGERMDVLPTAEDPELFLGGGIKPNRISGEIKGVPVSICYIFFSMIIH